MAEGLNRRELLGAGAAAGLALGLPGSAAGAAPRPTTLSFGRLKAGPGWPGWTCVGAANLRRAGGQGLLEASTDVFPSDPRPVAFAVDRRFRDGEIAAVVDSAGAGTGLVLRRAAHRTYYAAVFDDDANALVLLRRSPSGVEELARTTVLAHRAPLQISFSAHGVRPTVLTATLGSASVTAHDTTAALQRAGDPGVLATARTVFPSSGPAVLPALGNLHLLPYGVQEGEVVIGTPVGQAVLDRIRERSMAAFAEITLRPAEPVRPSPAGVVAATSGSPVAGGALLRVASDLPAKVEIEVALDRGFRHGVRRLPARATDDFRGAFVPALRLPPGRRVWWRARLRRRGRTTLGPARSFRSLPRPGSAAGATIAIGACASQFGPCFDHLIAARPDVFVWQGDLNYPDTVGPLAQSVSGYAGIWRDFLANPRMAPLLDSALFAAGRDDHDYGVQDANSTNLVPWGITPWEGLMERRSYYRFTAGQAEFWVLDQRRHKSSPDLPDTTKKTLLGSQQRSWLLRTLAASRAPFKVICSPCTVAGVGGNSRDGDWAKGFTAERDLLLAHIHRHVHGHALFVTGDTHWTMAFEDDRLFEARPCPLGIPVPNDITISDPRVAEKERSKPGVLYTDDRHGHFALVRVGRGRLELSMVREDGVVALRRSFVARV